MEQLSSCYFCGGALDASLDEYPVVPKALHPTEADQKTVVLCQGCRQKLGTVVETIVDVFDQETLDERDVAAGDAAAGRATAAGDATVDATDSSAGEDPLDNEGWVDAGELSSRDEAEEASAADGDDAPADDGSKDVTYTTSTAAGGRKSVAGNAESIRDEGGASGGSDGGAAAGDDEKGAGDDGSTDDGPTMTALENTKVMRLLQNREFPVDREEIKTVAVNAYDMDESRFDKVVDAAVEKGLIDERKGQFVETK